MMRLTVWMAGLTVLAGTAAGQRSAATMSPYRPMPAPVNATPFGNILFPGGTASHPMRLGATVAGAPYPGIAPPVGPMRPGHGGGPGRPRTIVVPYAVPVWSGGYGGGYYGYGEQPQPNVTVVMPQQPAPSVIINHHYGSETARPTVTTETAEAAEAAPERGGLRVYEATPRPAPAPAPKPATEPSSLVRDDKPNIYLIALKDGTVRQAIGYWSKAGALHFVTPAATIQQVSLSDLDRESTQRLNADRKLEFDLPFE